ncbi:uncharacterized protein I303_102608 [Kwoniella dejecticola CBS 10117]|uniref:Uncharacterized protein n=1 Tax=Kwoniella dejecticola CBS 10117 TaxID=1296121 RepID=A0A1A6A979_9TREE|nr:uncharacterized protein I303_02622 [Kwoniella dejecticola CBS 10117]OBR86613.1 hypothetical protein I303_02622 [Kwoniella dejecticola CBS 10117]
MVRSLRLVSCCIPLIVIFWIALRWQLKSDRSSVIWYTAQTDLSVHTYRHESHDLINITWLFEVANPDPIIQSLIRASFSHNLYEAKVIPFYRKKKDTFTSEQITLLTFITGDRLGRLVALAERRRAPISVAFYVPPDDETATQQLFHLDKLLHDHPVIAWNVDIHLVTSPYLLQLNTWRTVARTFATTDWVLLWDVDFEPCTDYQKGLEKFLRNTRDKGWATRLERGEAALVIPPFEWVDLEVANSRRDVCPSSKSELASLYHDLTLDAFETLNPVLSHATDYAHLLVAGETDYYEIKEYELGYEVYPIFRRDAPVWFDQRFVGYGFERSAITAQMYLSGMDLYVLPGEYAFHVEHSRSSSTHRDDIKSVQISWTTFRMDLCHTLGLRLAHKGELHTSAGERLVSACQSTGIDDIDLDIKRSLWLSGKTSWADSD